MHQKPCYDLRCVRSEQTIAIRSGRLHSKVVGAQARLLGSASTRQGMLPIHPQASTHLRGDARRRGAHEHR